MDNVYEIEDKWSNIDDKIAQKAEMAVLDEGAGWEDCQPCTQYDAQNKKVFQRAENSPQSVVCHAQMQVVGHAVKLNADESDSQIDEREKYGMGDELAQSEGLFCQWGREGKEDVGSDSAKQPCGDDAHYQCNDGGELTDQPLLVAHNHTPGDAQHDDKINKSPVFKHIGKSIFISEKVRR